VRDLNKNRPQPCSSILRLWSRQSTGRPGDERRLFELLLTFESTVEKSIKWVHKEDILCLEANDALKVIVTTVLSLNGVMGEWALPSLCSRLRHKAYAGPRLPAIVVSELWRETARSLALRA
jgi:hypothetical protein